MPLRWNSNGLQLADVPGTGVSRVASGQKSGNRLHDTRSGKFGSGGGGDKKPARAVTPQQADPLEYSRMLDAARDASRSFRDFDEAAVSQFIADRANSPDQVDVAAFIKIMEDQRKADLVDMLDQTLRSGKRPVRIQATGKYVKELLGKVGSDGMAEIMTRLEAMGHDRAKVDSFLSGRVDVHEEAKKKRDTVAASGAGWRGDLTQVIEMEDEELQEAAFDPAEYQAQFAEVMRSFPAPVINVEVKMPEGGGRKVVRRNDKGLIESIEDE